MTPKRVLLVDDDESFARLVIAVLNGAVDVRVISQPDQAMLDSDEWAPDLLLMDMLPKHMDAFSLADELRAKWHDTLHGVIFLAKGPGALTRLNHDAGELFGVVTRDAGPQTLRRAVLDGLAA